MQYQFGSGNLYGLVSSGGVLVPRKFGALQDVTIDFEFAIKELYGQYQFALALARGQGKITGKAKFANINGAMFNDIFFGQTNASGQTVAAVGEAATVPAATPWQVTVANAATFKDDLGVAYVATGVALTRVASGPAVGQYSVSASGVYTFATADANALVLIDYTYTVTTGNTTTIANQLTGTTPTFISSFPMKLNGKQLYFRLNACYAKKLSLATKIEDFVVPEFDFMASADASNNVGIISSTE